MSAIPFVSFVQDGEKLHSRHAQYLSGHFPEPVFRRGLTPDCVDVVEADLEQIGWIPRLTGDPRIQSPKKIFNVWGSEAFNFQAGYVFGSIHGNVDLGNQVRRQ